MATNTDPVREIVRALGGAKAVSLHFKITEAAVFNWIWLGEFPAAKSWGLFELARDKGFHLDPRDPGSFRPLSEDAA